jgi:hypothetical protein
MGWKFIDSGVKIMRGEKVKESLKDDSGGLA